MPHPFRLLFTLIFCSLTLFVNAQDGRNITGNWMMYFGQAKFSDKWSIHHEVQWRNHEVLPNLEQLLLRGGMNYHLNKNVMVTAGYGYISTHPFDKEVTRTLSNEHRIWQQLILRQNPGRVVIEHRYRYEQRWVNDVFGQRLRYRLFAAVPLNKPEITTGSILVAVYDEFFANVKQKVFDRNRLYAALGYQLSHNIQIQGGWLVQSVPAFSKHYLQLALFFNPDFTKGS